MFNLLVKKKIIARIRDQDGIDKGFSYLLIGNYLAKDTLDGYVQIERTQDCPLYLMSFVFLEKIRAGAIDVMNGAETFTLQ
jgi:hypothetical protein